MSGVEILDNGTHVLTAPRAAFGTDALLLGRLAQPRRAERALDLCSGCGIISLLWHDAGHRGSCTALELDPDASALCVQAVAEPLRFVRFSVLCMRVIKRSSAMPPDVWRFLPSCIHIQHGRTAISTMHLRMPVLHSPV